jgi:hypothetical protein
MMKADIIAEMQVPILSPEDVWEFPQRLPDEKSWLLRRKPRTLPNEENRKQTLLQGEVTAFLRQASATTAQSIAPIPAAPTLLEPQATIITVILLTKILALTKRILAFEL